VESNTYGKDDKGQNLDGLRYIRGSGRGEKKRGERFGGSFLGASSCDRTKKIIEKKICGGLPHGTGENRQRTNFNLHDQRGGVTSLMPYCEKKKKGPHKRKTVRDWGEELQDEK